MYATVPLQATWLSRLHDAQENYREACRKLDVKRLSTAERAAATAAGVDINVLQCDDNISFAESTTDVTASPQQTVGLFLVRWKFSSSCENV